MSIAGRRARDVGAERHRVAGRGGGGDRVSIRHACIACMQAVAADGAGLSLARGARLREPVFATDPRSDELEELQCTLGESPCIDALSADGAVLVTDRWSAGSARRWPTFAAAPVQGGVRAMFFDSGPDGCCRRPRRAESVPRPGPGPLTGGETGRRTRLWRRRPGARARPARRYQPGMDEYFDAEFAGGRAEVQRRYQVILMLCCVRSFSECRAYR
jgi:hypothetical protein